ncbi:LacI family transcriptional regulator [Vallitalea longa]|uniref:LacI family transcriptional regulator n=1 Tax=Vallitalea longa TaxID=2936439 RepID=A0A9W5YAA2_9FIRM|nr:LacI family DNA-binding transcriptional regulator [Vallitalea longa]GKX29444.1 LacI family transcriptional regulator [Vallitalea longa]
MITIKEMADIIGVSPTTVSNVIHGRVKETSKEMIEKVNKVIEEYNYIPNMSARTLSQNSSRIIGVVLKYQLIKGKNIMQDPFNSEILGSIEKNISEAGYYMMFYSSGKADDVLHLTATWNVDGLIVIGAHAKDCQKIVKHTNKPVIFIDCYFYNDGIEYVNIGLDDKKCAYKMTQYLIEEGHKNIAFLADNCIGVDEERFRGYAEGLQENGLLFKERNYINLDSDLIPLKDNLKQIYRRRKEFTALFCASDYYAMEVVNYLMDNKINVPDDISVVGFDDNILGSNMRPRLTTIRQNPTLKGKIAVKCLMRLIRKQPLKKKNIRLSGQLIIRDTVRKIE